MKTEYDKYCESLDNFRWRVNRIDTESCTFRDEYHPDLTVTILGIRAGRIPTFNFEDLTNNLERKLNSSEFKNKSLFGIHIKNVIFNGPATIIQWSDDVKTVVKTQNGEEFDPEKGIAMAIAKRMFGNTGSYFNEIKKWLPEEPSNEVVDDAFCKLAKALKNTFDDASKKITVVCEKKGSCANCIYFHRDAHMCHEGGKDGNAPKPTYNDSSCDNWEGIESDDIDDMQNGWEKLR